MTIALVQCEHGPGAVFRRYQHPTRGTVETLTAGNVITLRMPRNAYGWRERVDAALGREVESRSPSRAKRVGKRMRAQR